MNLNQYVMFLNKSQRHLECSRCSTSPPGGNQGDGLPHAPVIGIKNNTFNIQKDPNQSDDNDYFVKKFNSEIFKNRKYINFKKNILTENKT